MAISVAEKLRQDFYDASLKREAKKVMGGREWERYNDVFQRVERAKAQEKKLFIEQYDVRVAQERRRLMHEAGKVHKKFDAFGLGADGFNSEDNRLQAETNVRHRHENRLMAIDRIKISRLESLKQEMKQLRPHQGKAERAFNKTVDRREGRERRVRVQLREH